MMDDLAKYATVLSSFGLRLITYVFLRWVNNTPTFAPAGITGSED